MKFGLLILALWIAPVAHAYETDEGFGYSEGPQPVPERAPVKISETSDSSRIEKFKTALEILGIPEEPAPDFSDYVHANEVQQSEVESQLPLMDPDQGLIRYLFIKNGLFQLFRDFFSPFVDQEFLEFQQSLSKEGNSQDSQDLMQRLNSVALQVQSGQVLPLTGLKILIDPGHMGGDEWDQITGKYVSVNGRKVSEGSIALWTSLLLAQKLEDLGASVLLTRAELGPVSKENPAQFDVEPFRNTYFYNSLDDWMAPYLQKSADQLRTFLPNAPEVLKANRPSQRMQFFLFGSDLETRAKMIDAWNPDITLDIHFDAFDSTQLQNRVQSLEAFVPGAFRKNETGSRKSKALAIKHLLEVRRWKQSVELADFVTSSLSSEIRIPRMNVPNAFNGVLVRDGVYTRNLYLARRAMKSLLMYLECLHYDHVNEHPKLAVQDRTGSYRGNRFQYPNRLDAISDGIRNGILRYFEAASF